MLTLSIKKGETITIGQDVELYLHRIQGQRVVLSFHAPPEVSVLRSTFQGEVRYRGYTITNDNEIGRLSFVHDSYTGYPDDPNSTRCGFAETFIEAFAAINSMEGE